MNAHRTRRREASTAGEALVKNLDLLLCEANFSRQQFRIADGILQGTQHWVAQLAGTLLDREPMAGPPRNTAVRAARIDTGKLAEQLGNLGEFLYEAMGDDPYATLH